jgi:ribosome-binding factor A
MTQRTERVAGEIREILGEIIVRQEIKDPRVRIAGIITFTHVRMSGDLRQARAFFTVHGMDDESLERVRQGLTSAAPFMRRRIADRLRLKSTPSLAFEVDTVFEQEAHIDELLRQVSEAASEAASEASRETASEDPTDTHEDTTEDVSKKPD